MNQVQCLIQDASNAAQTLILRIMNSSNSKIQPVKIINTVAEILRVKRTEGNITQVLKTSYIKRTPASQAETPTCSAATPPLSRSLERSRLGAHTMAMFLAVMPVSPLCDATRDRCCTRYSSVLWGQGSLNLSVLRCVFHIHSAYYLVILYSFKNSWGVKIVKTVAINLLTSIDPS
ncbi:hypothetical protein E2C01_033558 [Portunus trituberculatus]|uniref:Uncharacterized protein n=1 Tax=Portunus trituberculatus TaxID=210409 RepID=A0A5B7F5T2_PORTR|nr:hypothetical protein [Portunus trituberculatus]